MNVLSGHDYIFCALLISVNVINISCVKESNWESLNSRVEKLNYIHKDEVVF